MAAAARGHVSGDEVRLLQKLRRRANDARHVWPSSKDGGRPAAEAIEVLQEQAGELGTRIARLEKLFARCSCGLP